MSDLWLVLVVTGVWLAALGMLVALCVSAKLGDRATVGRDAAPDAAPQRRSRFASAAPTERAWAAASESPREAETIAPIARI